MIFCLLKISLFLTVLPENILYKNIASILFLSDSKIMKMFINPVFSEYK